MKTYIVNMWAEYDDEANAGITGTEMFTSLEEAKKWAESQVKEVADGNDEPEYTEGFSWTKEIIHTYSCDDGWVFKVHESVEEQKKS